MTTTAWPPAVFSPDEDYRYLLSRQVSMWGGVLLFIMLNPSKASYLLNDPTIRRCIAYAQRWGYGTLLVCNLFALRGTNPNILKEVEDPVGVNNLATILETASKADRTVVAWGTHGSYLDQAALVTAALRHAEIELYCLGLTQDGFPRHPLYVPGNQELEVYQA